MHARIEHRRIPTSEMAARRIVDFVDTGLLKALRPLMFRSNLILKGPKGAGKSMALEQLASLENIPMIRQDCCEETSLRDLVGTFGIEGDKVFWQMGCFPTAIEVANEVGVCILVLEEINTLSELTQKMLNSMTDYRRSVTSVKAGKVWRLEPDKEVWVCGTMNPGYAGTYKINEDLRSRFEFIEVNYMEREREKELLVKQFPSASSALERQMLDKLLTLAGETRSEVMGYGLSTRDLVSFVRNYLATDLPTALKLLEGKYDGEQVRDFQARVMSTFSIPLTGMKLY